MWYIYKAEYHSALKKMKCGKVDEFGKYNVKQGDATSERKYDSFCIVYRL